MYIPKQFQVEDTSEIKSFIEQNGFAILISQAQGKLWGTHIPLLFSEDKSKLYGHISKANIQWKNFASNDEVLAIFNGPHAYISSSWYDHENVPTWNYIAAHVYGNVRIIEGMELYQSIRHLVNKYEKHSEHPVTLEGMSPDYVKKEMMGLVGFEITITRIEAACKLSQNRDKKNFEAITHQLEKRGDHDSIKIAEAMKRNTSSPKKHGL